MTGRPVAPSSSQTVTNAPVRRIIVRHLPANPSRGRLACGNLTVSCALGKGGITRFKREGDGATPAGVFALRRLWFRSKVGRRPICGLQKQLIRSDIGWCDASAHRCYNRPVRLPFSASHEKLWRDDVLYDIFIEIGWNDNPAVSGRGSAIFFHLARPGYLPTEGCVAVSRADMCRIITRIGPRTRITIG
jgi:L,D-peptidoglycan transpeptidase YkuD (ErfK/YbiS/YcfS/YnhG family)